MTILTVLFRMGDYKMIWGSRTVKNIWFPAKGEVLNTVLCDHVKKTRMKIKSMKMNMIILQGCRK